MGVSGLEHEDQAYGAHRIKGALTKFPICGFSRGCETNCPSVVQLPRKIPQSTSLPPISQKVQRRLAGGKAIKT